MSFIKNKIFQIIIAIIFCGLFFLGLRIIVSGQEIKIEKTRETVQTEIPLPILTDYKDVTIGMAGKEVKEILGKPKVEDKEGFYYIFSKEEQVQIGLDELQKVRVIVAMYDDKNGKAPKYEDIFGNKSEIVKQNNQNIYNLVRYPSVGFWVAYHRIGGDSPTVTVTIQRMEIQEKPN